MTESEVTALERWWTDLPGSATRKTVLALCAAWRGQQAERNAAEHELAVMTKDLDEQQAEIAYLKEALDKKDRDPDEAQCLLNAAGRRQFDLRVKAEAEIARLTARVDDLMREKNRLAHRVEEMDAALCRQQQSVP